MEDMELLSQQWWAGKAPARKRKRPAEQTAGHGCGLLGGAAAANKAGAPVFTHGPNGQEYQTQTPLGGWFISMSLIDESHPTHDGGPAVGGSAVGIDALLGAAGNENNRFLRELEKIDGGASGRLV